MHCFPFPSQDCHVLLLWLIRTPQFPMVSQRKWFTNKCCLLNLLYQKTCTCATWFDMFAKQYVISYVVIYIYIYLLKDTQSVLPNFTSRKMPFPWPLAPAPVSPRNSASQRCAEASQSRPGESLSAAARIWYLYVHTINAIRRSCVYIYIRLYRYMHVHIYIHYTHTIM